MQQQHTGPLPEHSLVQVQLKHLTHTCTHTHTGLFQKDRQGRIKSFSGDPLDRLAEVNNHNWTACGETVGNYSKH